MPRFLSNLLLLFIGLTSFVLAVPLAVNPRLLKVELPHDEVLTLKLMLLIDNVLPGQENIEKQNAHAFIKDVNVFTSGIGKLGTNQFQLNLVQVETMQGDFSNFSNTHQDNEHWRQIYMEKYSQHSDLGMLISKSNASPHGGYAQFKLCDHVAPAGLVTGFTWDRRVERVNTFTHEVGHIVGLRHDEEAGCNAIGLMSKFIHFQQPKPFTQCNIQQFQERLVYYKSCLPSALASSSSSSPSSLQGKAWNLDSPVVVDSRDSMSNPPTTSASTSSSSTPSEAWYHRIPYQVSSTPLPKIEAPRSQASEIKAESPEVKPAISNLDPPDSPSPILSTLASVHDASSSSLSSSQTQGSIRIARNAIEEGEEDKEEEKVEGKVEGKAAASTQAQDPMVSALAVAHSIVNNPIVKMAVTAGLSSQAPQLLPLIHTGLEMARPTVENILRENNIPLETSSSSSTSLSSIPNLASTTSSSNDRVDDPTASLPTQENVSEIHQQVGKFIHDLFNSFLESFSRDKSSSK